MSRIPEHIYSFLLLYPTLYRQLQTIFLITHTFLHQLKGRRTSHLSQDKDGHSHDPLLLQVVRKGHRRKAGTATGSARLMAITDCVDNSTQTDISFQNFLGAGRGNYTGCSSPKPPPSPPLPPMVESYLLNDL